VTTTTLSVSDRHYYQWALYLAVFTILYNLIEGIVATVFGYSDETLALFGFGVDSFIEMISGVGILVMILRIRNNPASERSEFEKTALRITGYSFFLLATGLILSALYTTYAGIRPTTTFWGVVISAISILVMLALIYGKIKAGNKLQSAAILADANCTKVCIYMSIVLLAASAIYEVTGFAYADALGTAGLAWFSLQEGRECFEKARHNSLCGCGHES
jgi:divalent metal cation (Fe/Co/Zn/Cd) transporter